MNNLDSNGPKKKVSNASNVNLQGQIIQNSAQGSQVKMDFQANSASSQSKQQLKENTLKNGERFQVQQFQHENAIQKKDENHGYKDRNQETNQDNNILKDPYNHKKEQNEKGIFEEHLNNENNKLYQAGSKEEHNQDKENNYKLNPIELKQSQKSNSSPEQLIQYNSDYDDDEISQKENDIDVDDEEIDQQYQENHINSQKNLNTNPPSQTQLERKISNSKIKSESLSVNDVKDQNGIKKQQNQRINDNYQKSQVENGKRESYQDYNNTQQFLKDANQLQNSEASQLTKSNLANIERENNFSNTQNNKSGGFYINNVHLNKHDQYQKQAKNNPFNTNTSVDKNNNVFGQAIFEKENAEIQQQQNPKKYRLSVLEEKFSTEQSDRLNEREFNSNNTNWNQTMSPDSKINRLSHQQMYNQKDSFFKENVDQLESEANNDNINNQAKDKESLIQFDDATSKDVSSYNSRNKQKKYSRHENIDQIIQKTDLNQESFGHHLSNNKRDLLMDSSHQLKELEESQLKRMISENHPKKNLLMKNEQQSSSMSESHQPIQDLGKHMGKELIGINNNQSIVKIVQNERHISTASNYIKPQQIINKKELEQKKERKIQKFCEKFFKDLLKNRSGVPTLTQNNRKMNLEAETPNPDSNFKQQKSSKDGQLNDGLKKELFNIEEHQKYRLVMDQFLKKFNKSPKEAIQFLIEKQLCDDSDEDIAYMLLTTEGLNKEQLGQYFGSNKERNQSILEAFCSLMDFTSLKFDVAIRLFLSRFRLPGEAQQIDRIVQKFTKIYTKDNPSIFHDEDTPYILCYSAIMLNVDAHSEKIEKSKKMQKSTYVHNNLLCTKNSVPKEFLEELYDNIVKEKFETKVDYIEKIYSRVPLESMSKQINDQNFLVFTKELKIGSNFLKYGRQGKPHMRKVYLSQAKNGDYMIVWSEIDDQVSIQIRKNTNQKITNDKKLKERHILVKDITDLNLGCNATEVMKRNNVPPEFDQFCFSIIANNRTLDLKSHDMETKFKWIAYIYSHLSKLRHERKNKNKISPAQKVKNEERINEIWKIDIFSKWEDHWDYTNSKPKNIIKFENKVDKPNFFKQICSFLSVSKNQNGSYDKISGKNTQNHTQVQQVSKLDYEELNLSHQSNKSLLLISLWKIGMPQWVRKTIWPLIIGNRLEITENLYKILLKQVKVFEEDKEKENKSIFKNSNNFLGRNLNFKNLHLAEIFYNAQKFQILFSKQNKQLKQIFFKLIKLADSIKKMKEDLQILKGKKLHSSLSETQQQYLENVLSAFIFYRPDVGYIKGAMPNLATILILQSGDEYTSFKSFINLLHSYHFLTFFRGEMSEIKWRVQFFNEYLQNRNPFLVQHFKALDLSSELFVMHWFLNLFSNVFDLETVFRIWDNFLLEGEVFAYKAGIAFLEYFHLEFKMATFDDALNLLKNPPEDEFCHDLYFDIIEDIKIPVKDFHDRLDQQNVAKLAPYILQQLL